MEIFSPDNIVVERQLGSYGFLNISSSSHLWTGVSMENFGKQSIAPGGVQTRLYTGRVTGGEKTGTRVLLKVYPGRNAGGPESDMMAANELQTHALLQSGDVCTNIMFLLGGFETKTGEQWLVFRNDGVFTGIDYVKAASLATLEKRAVGELAFWERLGPNNYVERRRRFIRNMLRCAFNGLSFLHTQGRLHQSLGPASIMLNTIQEQDTDFSIARLRDFAFSADVSFEALVNNTLGVNQPLAVELWRRAKSAGAKTAFDLKAFGIADDIYAGGLLLAFFVFSSLSLPGSIDGPSLQRLLETTFRLDVLGAREYCSQDERWEEAVKFLDTDDKAGWELLQAMLNPNYRQRPIADAVLCHRFLSEE